MPDIRTAVLAQSVIEKPNAVEFNTAMKCFLVKGSGDVVRMVRFTPKPTCSCRPTRTCYHITAVQRSIGTWTSPTKRTINLTQLRWNKRAVKQRPGRKRPRLGDVDVVAAPDAEAPSNDTASDAGDGDTVIQQQHMNTDTLQQLTTDQYKNAAQQLAQLAADDKLVVVSCTLSNADLMTLDGVSWVNDSVMHSYLALLSRLSSNRVFVLPSFLAVRWQNSNISDSSWNYDKVAFSDCKWLLMPVHLRSSHWALLIADITAQTIGLADSMPSRDTAVIEHFKQYMSARAAITGELASWTDRDYSAVEQQDGSSCGVLALMAAEAVINDAPLNVIDATMVTFYRQYIKARLILNSRRYDNATDAVCDLPFCSRPSGKKIAWTQCDRCNRWCHNVCVGRPSSCMADKNNPFLCSIC